MSDFIQKNHFIYCYFVIEMKYLFLVFVVIFLTSCSSSLLTPYNKKIGYLESDEIKGRNLLLQAQQAVNIKKIKKQTTYTVYFKDCFFGFSGTLANPFKNKCTEFELKLSPGSFNSEMTFLSGKEKGLTVGLTDWKTYRVINNQKVYKKDKRTQFWLPTYQYFIELPLRILEADKICYAGTNQYNGEDYNLVLATWKSYRTQKTLDQYLIWVSKSTHRIEIVQYTIRDMSRLIKGTTFYNNYKSFNGILFPTQMNVSALSRQKKKLWKPNKLMHSMEIINVK